MYIYIYIYIHMCVCVCACVCVCVCTNVHIYINSENVRSHEFGCDAKNILVSRVRAIIQLGW